MLDYINITKIKVNITLSVKSLQIFKIKNQESDRDDCFHYDYIIILFW